jgi:nucleoside-diphosphate-sugar epimerase
MAASSLNPHVLIVGCGDLGSAVARQLTAAGVRVSGTRRNPGDLPEGVDFIQLDVTDPGSVARLSRVHPDVLLYCVAAGAQTDDNYKAHYVDGLRHVLQALQPGQSLRHVFFVSSTRGYGQTGDALLDETTPPLPVDFGGVRLLEAEAVLAAMQVPSTVLRLSGIYGPGRTRLIDLARLPSAWPQQNVWTNRIHRDDAARFIAHCMQCAVAEEALAPLYVVTDSAPVAQYEVLQWLAAQQGVEAGMIKPPQVSGGKRLSNARMLATGFTLQYPDYRSGYGALLAG